MEYEMTFRFTKEEYETLTNQSEQTGQEIKEVIRELIHELRDRSIQLSRKPDKPNRLLSKQELQEYLYRKGTIRSIPTGEKRTPEEEARLEELGKLFGQGQPLSEIIMEDRGPY
jgi:hypothetical protein